MNLEMIAYLAELGKLNFTPEEMKKMAADMTSIINIMDTVKEIDVEYDVEADNKNVYLNDLREDISAESFPTERSCKMPYMMKTVSLCPKL